MTRRQIIRLSEQDSIGSRILLLSEIEARKELSDDDLFEMFGLKKPKPGKPHSNNSIINHFHAALFRIDRLEKEKAELIRLSIEAIK